MKKSPFSRSGQFAIASSLSIASLFISSVLPLMMGRSAIAVVQSSSTASSSAQLSVEPPAAPVQLAQAANTISLLRNLRHGDNVLGLAFSPNGQYLASAASDRRLRVWNVDAVLQGDEQRFVRHVIDLPSSDRYGTSLAFSPDNRYLVSGTFNGDVRVWDLNACDPERNTCASEVLLERDYRGVAPAVQFSPNGQLLAASSFDGSVTVWNWSNRTVLTTLEAETGRHTGERQDGRFSSLAFSPDGQYLVAGSHDTTITIWDLEDDFERVEVVKTRLGVESVKFSPDGETLAAGNLDGIELRSFRNVRGRLQIGEPVAMAGRGRVNSLTYGRGGQLIFSGDNSGNVMVWDTEEEEALGTAPTDQQHNAPVLAVVLNPDGDLVATSSSNGEIKLWRP